MIAIGPPIDKQMTQDCDIDSILVMQFADNAGMLLTISITVISVLISLPAFSLLLIALMSNRRSENSDASDPKLPCQVCVIIPAHNEEHYIGGTVATLRKQLTSADEVLVIADNCTDRTASIARTSGARVIERSDQEHRGKAYALEFAREVLNRRYSQPEVVIVVDADCDVKRGSISRLCQAVRQSQGPVQALNLMDAPQGASLRTRLLAFAFLLKNSIRPMGLAKLGAGCTLTGTGMAFPWALFSRTPLASKQLAEDLALSKWFASQGIRAQLCPQAIIRSTFPEDPAAQHQQKKRWEHGHMAALFKGTGAWIMQILRKRQWPDGFLILDTLTPPLSLYSLFLMAMLAIFTLLHFFEFRTPIHPTVITGLGALALVAAIMYSRYTQGLQLIHWYEWLTIPIFMAWKLPIYIKYLTQPSTQWHRTRRPNESDAL